MSQAVILVVEDDAELRAALCDTLTLAGYKVETANEGQAALDILEKQTERLGLIQLFVQQPIKLDRKGV